MNIATQIIEESGRFETAYGFKPSFVFIGTKQANEIDAVISDMRKLGLIGGSGACLPRAKIDGMSVFRVDAESHLSFGTEQPSPCG